MSREEREKQIAAVLEHVKAEADRLGLGALVGLLDDTDGRIHSLTHGDAEDLEVVAESLEDDLRMAQ